MSSVEPRAASALLVLPALLALERAVPLPSPDELAIEGLTEAEWHAFRDALESA